MAPNENSVVRWSVETKLLRREMDVCVETTGPLHPDDDDAALISTGLTDRMHDKAPQRRESRFVDAKMSKRYS
jgi:hypothetical protein